MNQEFGPQHLIEAARQAQQQAYAKYSGYQVGAAILATDGQIYSGCNIENASYGLTLCAERVAVGNAVTAGAVEFTALAIATADGGTPCGACRQVLAEFCDDLPIWLVSTSQEESEPRIVQLADLLPSRFGLD